MENNEENKMDNKKNMKRNHREKFFSKEEKSELKQKYPGLYSANENEAYQALEELKNAEPSVKICNFLVSDFVGNKQINMNNTPLANIAKKLGANMRDITRNHSEYFKFMNTLAEQGKHFAKTVMSSLKDAATAKDNKYDKYLSKIKRLFSEEEDAKLTQLVEVSKDKMNEKNYWGRIAEQMPGRTARQCRGRWSNYISPNVQKTNWTPEKDDVLRRSVEGVGPKWGTISNFTNESPNSCKNRYNILLREQQPSLNETNYIGNPNTNQTNQPDNMNIHPMSQVADLDLTNPQQLMNPQQSTNLDVQPKIQLPSIFELTGEQIDLSSSLNLFEDIGNDFSLEQKNQQQDQGPTPNFD